MSYSSAIDYKPLEVMDHAWARAYKQSFRGLGLMANTVILLIGFALLFLLTVLGFFIIVLWFVGMAYYLSRFKNAAWQAFAGANGWGLDETTDHQLLIPPSLMAGHTPVFSPVIQANIANISCDLFTYQYTVGEGKYQQTFVFTVAAVPLELQLPHIILYSKKAHPRMENDLTNHEHLNLEGDFNNYFKLEVEKGQEVDVLTILTPDVMQTLVSYGQAEDIEIYSNALFFIMNSDKRDPQDVKQLIVSVEKLAGQITENVRLATAPKPVEPTTTQSTTTTPAAPVVSV